MLETRTMNIAAIRSALTESSSVEDRSHRPELDAGRPLTASATDASCTKIASSRVGTARRVCMAAAGTDRSAAEARNLSTQVDGRACSAGRKATRCP